MSFKDLVTSVASQYKLPITLRPTPLSVQRIKAPINEDRMRPHSKIEVQSSFDKDIFFAAPLFTVISNAYPLLTPATFVDIVKSMFEYAGYKNGLFSAKEFSTCHPLLEGLSGSVFLTDGSDAMHTGSRYSGIPSFSDTCIEHDVEGNVINKRSVLGKRIDEQETYNFDFIENRLDSAKKISSLSIVKSYVHTSLYDCEYWSGRAVEGDKKLFDELLSKTTSNNLFYGLENESAVGSLQSIFNTSNAFENFVRPINNNKLYYDRSTEFGRTTYHEDCYESRKGYSFSNTNRASKFEDLKDCRVDVDYAAEFSYTSIHITMSFGDYCKYVATHFHKVCAAYEKTFTTANYEVLSPYFTPEKYRSLCESVGVPAEDVEKIIAFNDIGSPVHRKGYLNYLFETCDTNPIVSHVSNVTDYQTFITPRVIIIRDKRLKPKRVQFDPCAVFTQKQLSAAKELINTFEAEIASGQSKDDYWRKRELSLALLDICVTDDIIDEVCEYINISSYDRTYPEWYKDYYVEDFHESDYTHTYRRKRFLCKTDDGNTALSLKIADKIDIEFVLDPVYDSCGYVIPAFNNMRMSTCKLETLSSPENGTGFSLGMQFYKDMFDLSISYIANVLEDDGDLSVYHASENIETYDPVVAKFVYLDFGKTLEHILYTYSDGLVSNIPNLYVHEWLVDDLQHIGFPIYVPVFMTSFYSKEFVNDLACINARRIRIGKSLFARDERPHIVLDLETGYIEFDRGDEGDDEDVKSEHRVELFPQDTTVNFSAGIGWRNIPPNIVDYKKIAKIVEEIGVTARENLLSK